MELEKYCDEVVILDFETTGLSADEDRIIEVGAVIVKGKKVIGKFSELMYPECHLPYFITDLTGISSAMLRDKPIPQKIMPKLKKFIGNRVILAHNASFDSKFLYAEMARANLDIENEILCTMLLSRRLIPDVYDYKLGTLAEYLDVKIGRAHRAIDDALATAKLWNHLHGIVSNSLGIKKVESNILKSITKKPKKAVPVYLEKIKKAYLQ